MDGISAAPVYIPKENFYMDHSNPRKPVMRIKVDDKSTFIYGKKGDWISKWNSLKKKHEYRFIAWLKIILKHHTLEENDNLELITKI